MTILIPKGVSRKLGLAAYEAGKAAGEVFQTRFDASGGRERKLPDPPYEDRALAGLWQAGFDEMTESARMEMTCRDCGRDLRLYEEQICEDCLEQFEEM